MKQWVSGLGQWLKALSLLEPREALDIYPGFLLEVDFQTTVGEDLVKQRDQQGKEAGQGIRKHCLWLL